jgi:predicted methyltransferase
MILKDRNDLIEVQKEAVKEIESYDCRILVCSGTGCVASGSEKIYEKFQELLKDMPEFLWNLHTTTAMLIWELRKPAARVFVSWDLL